MKKIYSIQAFLFLISILCFSLKCHAKSPNEVDTAKKQSNSSKLPTFSLTGTVYSSLPYIVDDNPAGFTQTYLQANLNRGEKRSRRYISLFHSFYLEGYFSTNAGTIHTYDTTSTKPVSYVNRLDLFQYANSKLNMHENIIYIRSHPGEDNTTWKTAFYIDLMESFLRTNVTDSISKMKSNVNSWLLGGNLTLQVYNDQTSLPMGLRLSGELFCINPLTNSFSPDQAFQYANRGDALNTLNAKKSLTANPYPYYNIDAQVQFQISSKTRKNGNTDTPTTNLANNFLFLHFGYVSNFAGSTADKYYNSYLSAQIGVSIDIINSIKNYTTPK